MPVSMHITTQGDEKVIAGLRALGVQIIPLTQAEIKRDLETLKSKVSKPGSRPTYPINWDSEKQRRAFFATKGFGGGIPYARTGRYENAWRISRSGSGFVLENPSPQSIYISGDENARGQSRIHRGRWPLWALLVDEHLDDTSKDAERAIEREAQRLGF
jgi:hypothetical protein